MRLVGYSTIRGGLHKRRVSRQHQTLRALHSPPHHIAVRRVAQTISESADEVGGAQSNEGGQIARTKGRVQVGLDMRGEAADPPWSQAPASLQGAACSR